jgi:predicted dehydrogenase
LKEIRIGIVGSGRMGARHAEAYSRIPGVRLAGFFDVDSKKAQELAGRYAAKAFSDVASLVGHSGVDAVNICTPNKDHVSPAVMAAEAGKHILVEKPLATTVRECDKIIHAARKAGVRAMVGQTHRFYPSNVAAKKIIDNGDIGSVRMIQDFYMDPGALSGTAPEWVRSGQAGGIITDSIHFVDRISWYASQEIKYVHTLALDKIRKEAEIDEISMVSLKLSGGASANLMTFSPSWGARDNQTRILGTDGVLYVKYGEEVRTGRQKWRVHDFPFRSIPPIFEHNLAGFTAELAEFTSSIMEDRMPAVTLEEGKKAVKAVLAIQESFLSGKPVSI